jgi:exopolysaccharide production protein ExoQ
MPPQIALIICSIFVIFLLYLERKQSPDVSLALWIPTIWLFVIDSKPLGIWFQSGGTMEEGSALDRVFLIVLLCLGFIVLTKRRFNWSNAIKENTWLMILIGYMLVSIVWSEMPFISFKRWIRELVAVVMAFLIASEVDPRQALQSIFRRAIYVFIPFSYILIHYFPEYGRQYAPWSGALMWTGVATQKNGLARVCLFAAFYLIWTFIRRKQGRDAPVAKYQTRVEVFILILTIWLFMGPKHSLTYSATSTTSLAIGLTALFCFSWMKKRGKFIGANTLMVIIVAINVYGTITPFLGGLTLFDVASTLGRDETLTGRSDIWAVLVPYAIQKPFWGHGFGGFWTEAMRSSTSSHAHNGYLDIILNIGFFGLILFTMFLLSCSRKAQKVLNQDFDWGAFWICYLLMAVIHNIAESSVVGFTSGMAKILMFLMVCLPSTNSESRMTSP